MRLLPLFILLCCLRADADELDSVIDILNAIEATRSIPILFTERRSSRLLDEPLILSGEITFIEGGALRKQISRPVVESVLISADTIELSRNGKTRRLSMDRRGDLKAFYLGMQALLTGDSQGLLELFEASSSVEQDAWTIDLVPKTAELRKFLSRLTVTGRGSQIRTLLTEQPGGDWQEMSFGIEPD